MQILEETDGGRLSEGFGFERNDCVVRCFAVAFSIPYADAHRLVAIYCGRKDGQGVNPLRLLKHLEGLGTVKIVETPRTIHGALCRYPTGTHIVMTKNHIFCTRDGAILDTWFNSPRTLVTGCWEVLLAK